MIRQGFFLGWELTVVLFSNIAFLARLSVTLNAATEALE